MAKAKVNIEAQCSQIISDVRGGRFSPVYLLMGDEPYYPELVCREILALCIPEEEKDFNETVCYGGDVTAEQVISAARRFPMMAERQLVVLKEAQMMAGIEDLSVYCNEPLDSTVLVILLHKGSVDKRRALYKAVCKCGTVVDSPELRDYEMPRWISSYFEGRGLRIEPGAAALLAEYAGTDLSKITVETDKMLRNLPEGAEGVTVEDIEDNVGISRQFSVFELTKALSYRDAPKALKIAANIGSEPRFYLPAAISAIYTSFNRVLRYEALLMRGGRPSPEDKAKALAGVNPYFYAEYDAAVKNYPLPKTMAVISLLCRYDYLSKGGDGALSPAGELLAELCAKILNI